MNITLTPSTYGVTATEGQHVFTLPPAVPLLLALDGAFLAQDVDYKITGPRTIRLERPCSAGQKLFVVTLAASVS